MSGMPADGHIPAVRSFNRFYTRRIGVLRRGLLGSRYSLAESRVLYELAHRDDPTPTALARALDVDAGYLSRILRAFERSGLVVRRRSRDDGRSSHVSLTASGRRASATLEALSTRDVETMLHPLSAGDRRRLVSAMGTIETLIGERKATAAPYILRGPQPGDMGWVVQQHGALYAQEYGYDEHFESLVASIVSTFVEEFDPAHERCWIAEMDGQPVGSILLVRKSAQVAKLRLLIVSPAARGFGIGGRLVAECVRFAGQAGYKKITLWTHSQLLTARHLYREAGFTLVAKQPTHSFGKDLVDETWELAL
jgi:DNA-binding MarR family transcriptional regulator/N-acetylglutamate synthase-like GNAT family acetyltransferase